MEQVNYLRIQKEKEDIIVLKESFNQLGKLEEECNQELSNFQRENFIAHEEFRAVTASIFESIDKFGQMLNSELDKLQLKINSLETIAMHAFNICADKIISCPGATLITTSDKHIYVAFNDGKIICYDMKTHKELFRTTKEQYDSIDTYGKITCFKYTTRLFVGFYSGMVVCFSDDLSKSKNLEYTTTVITEIHQFKEVLAVGAMNGLIVLWNAETLERLFIFPQHKLSIESIIDDGEHFIIAGKTGIITKHDKMCQQQFDKISIGKKLLQLLPMGKDTFVTIGEQLLMWEGKHVVKTFNAIDIGDSPIACIKAPELLVLGNKSSTQLRFIFLESLLFPKTVDVLDKPPLDIVHFGPLFYVLTKAGSIFVIKPKK